MHVNMRRQIAVGVAVQPDGGEAIAALLVGSRYASRSGEEPSEHREVGGGGTDPGRERRRGGDLVIMYGREGDRNERPLAVLRRTTP